MNKEPLPPSLTGDELKRIAAWERTHQSKVVRRLLAEIARLQAIALRADQVERALRADGASLEFNSLHIVVDCLRSELDELPLIHEDNARKERLLNVPVGKRKDERR